MLTITVLGDEHWDEERREFITTNDIVLELEHSLATLSKWESIYNKPFLGKDEKTSEEVLGYIKCMVQTPNPPEEVFYRLSKKNYDAIDEYINAKQTATWFTELPGAPKTRETITAELVYYWMFSGGVPMECQHWHLNRLFTLLRVISTKSGKPKKMSRSEIARQNAILNEQRKQQLGTSG